MKLEVGMYVRYDGEIGKIIYLCDCDLCVSRGYEEPILDNKNIFITNYDHDNNFKNIKKASHNIIDLIEVGDYVNGCKIESVVANKYFNHSCGHWEQGNIKEILTKEQYEANCYMVVG